MSGSYWQKVTGHRLDRRHMLVVTGGLSASAAILAACGSSSSSSSGPASNKSSLVSPPADTTQQAKRNGTMKDRAFADPPTLDVVTANNPWNTPGFCVYSSLVQFKPGYLKPSENEVAPDLAESWETSPDGLAITMKIREGAKWHNKPPINGRALDIQDVQFSWDRFAAKYGSRTSIANSADPSAPVLSLTATDARTIVLKLKEPLAYALGLFCPGTSGGVTIVPKETDSTLDLRGDMIGTGPWMLSNYTPSVGFTMKRHPDYWDKDYALVEQIEAPIITEYAAALAQLKAGNIYEFGQVGAPVMKPEDVLPLKQEEPRISVYQSELTVSPGGVQSFGWLPAGKSPFLDERVRQAAVLSIDRDLYNETFFNVSKFQSQGVPVDARWGTALVPTFEGWWLDPKGKDFGPNAMYFQHDLATAKKLLTAAGYPNGFDTISSAPGVELPYAKAAQVIDGMIAESGIRSQARTVDYAKEYIPGYRDAHGQYEGWAYMSTAGATSGGAAIGALAIEYWSKGGAAFHGFSLNNRNDQSGDPQLDAMIEKARVEQDLDRRKALAFDMQRYLGKANYAISAPGGATGLTAAWPALGNFRVFQGARNNYRFWIDDAKPPLKG
jgi:peptide/nickel transport system substrate-binding protein